MIFVSWMTQTLSDVPDDDTWLTGVETATLARLRFPKRRADWRLGRWTAKRALASSFGVRAAFEVRAADDGAPEAFVAGAPAPCSISISHAAGRAACAVAPAGAAVGCDVELVAPRGGVLAADYFTDAERDAVDGAAEGERDLVETVVWSAKESALKALREGLRLDTRSVEVRLSNAPAADGWRPLAVEYPSTGASFGGWWRRDGNVVVTVVAAPEPALPSRLAGSPSGRS